MMVDFFCYLYLRLDGSRSWVASLRGYSFLRYLVRTVANFILPVYFRLTGGQSLYHLKSTQACKDCSGVIISLTTYPGRINTVWLAIETLLRQSVKPDAIILWLSTDQFKSLSDIPRSLLVLVERGLRIEFREGDLRSHKKYFYARKEFPNATLVLADDDIFYPTNMLKDLVDLSCQYKGKVICRFAKKIQWAESGRLLPYIEWKKVNDSSPREDIFFGSGGGVLIPPSAVHEDLLNERAFLDNCLLADDIWLNAMCRLVSREMISTATPFSLLPVANRDKTDLSSVNNGQLMNDRQLERVIAYCKKVHDIDPFELK